MTWLDFLRRFASRIGKPCLEVWLDKDRQKLAGVAITGGQIVHLSPAGLRALSRNVRRIAWQIEQGVHVEGLVVFSDLLAEHRPPPAQPIPLDREEVG